MALTYLSSKQRITCNEAVARVNIAHGSVRSGKTLGFDTRWMEIVRNAPPRVDLLMIGKTERTLKRNIINPIIDRVGTKRARYVQGEGEFHLFGRRIYCVGANDESSEAKIRGMSLYAAYGDEMTLWPESFWEMLKSRLSEPGAMFLGTTNPGTPTHWLKQQIDRAAWTLKRDGTVHHRPMLDPDVLPWKIFEFKLEDNEFLVKTNPQYIEHLKREYRGLWKRRFIDGEWVAAEGAIFPMFDLDKHVVSTIPEIAFVISDGIDYGTSNPTAGVSLGLGVDGRLYLFSEWSPRLESSDAELVTDFGAWRRRRQARPITKGADVEPMYTFVDPAGASLKRELRKRLYPRILNGHNKPVVDSLRVIGALIDRDLLKVHLSCENVIREMGGYVWDPAATKRGKDEPLKENDHWIDAVRYAVYSSRGFWMKRLAADIEGALQDAA